MIEKTLIIFSGECWNCNSNMKIDMTDWTGNPNGPDKFFSDEIKLAQKHGVLIDKIQKVGYYANICPKCSSFIGPHYLYPDYYSVLIYNDRKYIIIHNGFHCIHCNPINFFDDAEI